VSANNYKLTPYYKENLVYTKETRKKGTLELEITTIPALDDTSNSFNKTDDLDYIIITREDIAIYLLLLRNISNPFITFYSIFLVLYLSTF
jgi:hypothetical protein